MARPLFFLFMGAGKIGSGTFRIPKSFFALSHQNRSGRTDFGRKTCQNRSPRTTFAAKIGPAGPILAAKNGPLLPKSVPHGGPILAKNLPKLVPLKVALLFLRVHGYMDAAIISSYAWLSS